MSLVAVRTRTGKYVHAAHIYDKVARYELCGQIMHWHPRTVVDEPVTCPKCCKIVEYSYKGALTLNPKQKAKR